MPAVHRTGGFAPKDSFAFPSTLKCSLSPLAQECDDDRGQCHKEGNRVNEPFHWKAYGVLRTADAADFFLPGCVFTTLPTTRLMIDFHAERLETRQQKVATFVL